MMATKTIKFRFSGYYFDLIVNSHDYQRCLSTFQKIFPGWTQQGLSACGPEPIKLRLENLDSVEGGWLSLLLETLADALTPLGFSVFHGALLTKADRCLVIAGPSRSGKSLFCFGMAKFGYSVLTDDMMFIRINDSVMDVIPVPRVVRTRSPAFRKQAIHPVDCGIVQISLDKVDILLPKHGGRFSINQLTGVREKFQRLSEENVFANSQIQREQVSLQLKVRSAFARSCSIHEYQYEDELQEMFGHVASNQERSLETLF